MGGRRTDGDGFSLKICLSIRFGRSQPMPHFLNVASCQFPHVADQDGVAIEVDKIHLP